jgi:hypothetical protein
VAVPLPALPTRRLAKKEAESSVIVRLVASLWVRNRSSPATGVPAGGQLPAVLKLPLPAIQMRAYHDINP